MPNADAAEFSRYRAELAPTEFVRAIDKEIACGPLGGSGRRLKAHHLVSDGDVTLGGGTGTWVDAETGQSCNFRVAADGVLRCLPTEYPTTSERVLLFADATCNRALVNVSRCRDNVRGAPKFVVWDEVAEECIAGWGSAYSHTVVHALGAAFTPSALYTYTFDQPARCVPIDEAGFGLGRVEDLVLEFEFRELGSEVAPSTFVAGSVETP